MPKGGARARSGPAPDPNALRRDRDAGDWLDLPAAGRDGDPPAWPLSAATPREAELWESEWRRPQAIVWERNGQELEVAMYVRAVVDAESPRASVASRTLVRQQMDSLGLTVPGLLRNRWRIVDQVQAPAGQQRTSRRGSARERLKVVKGGA
jgi:hypothetical protein